MKKIILVNQVTGPMFIDLANHYSNQGYNVLLFTGQVEQTGQSLHKSVTLVKCTKYRRNNPVLRIFTWIQFFFQVWIALKSEEREARVMLVSNPPFVPLLAHYLRKKKNLTFCILIYDIYPDVLERAGYFSNQSWIAKLWRKTNRKAYQQATQLYTISEGMKEVLTQYAPSNLWMVVYPWVDTSFIKPIPKSDNPFVKKYNLQNKTVVLYSGNMGATHDLMTVMKVAKALENCSDYFFLLIGDGAEKQRLMSYAKKHGLKNTLFLPFQKPETLPWSLTAADIGIVTLTGAVSQLSVPSKTFYQMAAGNALLCIAEPNSELAKIVLENNCGIAFQSTDVHVFKTFLSSLTSNEIAKLGINSRTASNKFTNKNVKHFL